MNEKEKAEAWRELQEMIPLLFKTYIPVMPQEELDKIADGWLWFLLGE